ncbi:MAG TPA: MlaD family protein, partial [Fibrobacteraceae bacterium]|nr:MlaD family protein [Fibrobacteraceae bacterium]
MSKLSVDSEFSAGNARFAVGLLVFMALIVGAWLAFHPKSPLRPYHDYYVLFPEIGSLEPGSVVQILGLSKGYVAHADLSPKGVLARLRIEASIRLPRDSKFRIISAGLLGQNVVTVRLGSDPEVLEQGDTLAGTYDPASTRLFIMARDLLQSTSNLVNTTLDTWDSTLGLPENQQQLHRMEHSIRQTASYVPIQCTAWKDSLTRIKAQIETALEQFQSAESVVHPKLDSLSKGVRDLEPQVQRLSSQMQ